MHEKLNEFEIFAARNSRSPHEFAERLGLRFVVKGGKSYCIRRLINRHCKRYGSTYGMAERYCVCELVHGGLCIDHPFAFRYQSDSTLPFACFVWFPYYIGEPYGSSPDKIAQWCKTHNLRFKIFKQDTGWYGHGSHMVCVWREWEIQRGHKLGRYGDEVPASRQAACNGRISNDG